MSRRARNPTPRHDGGELESKTMSERKGRTAENLEELRNWGGPAEMSAFEAAMWLAEADPRMRVTVTGVLVLDRAPDWARVVEGHLRITNAVPRLRQRVMEPALGVGLPQWVDDPDFLLDYHLRRQRAPEPGDDRQLLDIAQNLAMEPFDRLRPLWTTTLVEGLEHGRAALILKIHHVLSDGIGITQLLDHVVSDARESRALPLSRRAAPGRTASPTGLAAHSAGQFLRQAPSEIAGVVASALESTAGILRRPAALRESWDYIASAGRLLASQSTSGSPILRRRSRNWRFDIIELLLSDLKAAAKGAEASINDVFLAGMIGGFRRYHEEMGVQIKEMPIALPISLRTTQDPAGGNRFAGAQYVAPVAERDPMKRVAHVRDFVRRARREPALDVAQRLSPLLVRLPSSALGMVAGHMTSVQDAQISNVQGWDRPVYVAGSEVLHQWPFAPAPGCAMMITMLSYNGHCAIGITSDVAAVTEPELLVTCLREGLEEILQLGKPPAAAAPVLPAAAPSRKPRKRRNPGRPQRETTT